MARKRSNRRGFALGALMGGLFGGITALLFAPKRGEELRKDLTDKYHKASDKTSELFDDLCEHSSNLYNEAREQASKLIKRKQK